MVRSLFRSRRSERRTVCPPIVPACEALESRTVLSGSSVSVAMSAALLNPGPIDHKIHQAQANSPALGTISGQVNNLTGKGIGHIKVQLIDSNGDVVQTHITNARGQYRFKVTANGAYVVREVTPIRYTQTSPTFASTAPVGALAPGFGNNSWTYSTGNSNPANGPVGVYFWDTVAPAGDLPFESPINITVPPINLRPYLSVNYNNTTVPTDIINNGHQIQVQYTNNLNDTITVGGQVFNLAQFHYHDPSEHTVNGHGSTMEEHFVNTSAAGATTVVAVFLQLGAHNDALDPILNAASANLTASGSKTTISAPIDLAGLLPSNLEGWFYEGSLTAPALSQPVNWFVLSTPITLDYQQLKQYEAVASGAGFLPNARPTQPLDGRQVNQFAFDVNFQNQSVAGLNFTNAPRRNV